MLGTAGLASCDRHGFAVVLMARLVGYVGLGLDVILMSVGRFGTTVETMGIIGHGACNGLMSDARFKDTVGLVSSGRFATAVRLISTMRRY